MFNATIVKLGTLTIAYAIKQRQLETAVMRLAANKVLLRPGANYMFTQIPRHVCKNNCHSRRFLAEENKK